MARPKRLKKGRPPWAITKAILSRVEKLGASGMSGKMAAQGLGINQDTFYDRLGDNEEFWQAWQRGRMALMDKFATAAPKIYDGLIKNATHRTKAMPGGIVSAQLGFIEKALRRTDADESQTKKGDGQIGKGTEVREIIFRITTANPNSGEPDQDD